MSSSHKRLLALLKNQKVIQQAPELLLAFCESALPAALGLRAEIKGDSVLLYRNGERVAWLRHDGAAVWKSADSGPVLVRGDLVGADLLEPGEFEIKRDKVAWLIRTSSVGRAPRKKRSPAIKSNSEFPDPHGAELVHEPPSNARSAQVEQMASCSRLLRTKRVREFGLTVELSWRHDQVTTEVLTLHPVRCNSRTPELPFEYRFKDRVIEAALRVAAHGVPMPLAIYGTHGPQRSTLRPWLLALVGAAELLCDESSGGGNLTDWRPPTSWTPTEETAQLAMRHVPGHLRRLPEGSASDEQRRYALQIGIELPETGATWVRPHIRGVAPTTVLRYSWKPKLARG